MSNPFNNAGPMYPTLPAKHYARSGLIFLRDAVRLYFQENQVEAVVTDVGSKYRSYKLNQDPATGGNRVTFIPGIFDGDASPKPRDYGSISRGTSNSASVVNPREIALWERPFTMAIWAAPPIGRQTDEELAHALVEDLLEQTIRGIYSAFIPNPDFPMQSFGVQAAVTFGNVTLTTPAEKIFGVEILVQASLQGPLFDQTLDVVYPQAGGINRTIGGM